jgi:hypothetical protein
MWHRLGCVIGVFASIGAVSALPAGAATHTLPVAPATSHGGHAAGEDPVLQATVRLPPGPTDELNDIGLYWAARKVTDDRRGCIPFAIVSASASPRPIPLPKGARREQSATVTLQTASGPRRVVASSYTDRKRGAGFNRVVRLELPTDLIPAWGGAGREDRLAEFTSLAGIGDFDGDGRPDLLVGARGNGAAGAAYVLPAPA